MGSAERRSQPRWWNASPVVESVGDAFRESEHFVYSSQWFEENDQIQTGIVITSDVFAYTEHFAGSLKILENTVNYSKDSVRNRTCAEKRG